MLMRKFILGKIRGSVKLKILPPPPAAAGGRNHPYLHASYMSSKIHH
jgi:hypothetical protein